ncbi:calcium, potassium:sodium antiporter [Aureococcus anophagefferens]|nr:calcium, potassium:sodium antiporter [Aureococcus anophagefferens]
MAAGGSAPELATPLMGQFVSRSDIGFGTIVGSAVFNVLFVIGMCALVVPGGALPLTWWPLFRDCSYYIMGLLVLAACVSDESMVWYEALILFLLYLCYVTIMAYNEPLEIFTTRQFGMEKNAKAKKAASDGGATTVEVAASGGGAPSDAEGVEAAESPGPDAGAGVGVYSKQIYDSAPDGPGAADKAANGGEEAKGGEEEDEDEWEDPGPGLTTRRTGSSHRRAPPSSMYMAREGRGDMAISSSIGSNVFDILVGLPCRR